MKIAEEDERLCLNVTEDIGEVQQEKEDKAKRVENVMEEEAGWLRGSCSRRREWLRLAEKEVLKAELEDNQQAKEELQQCIKDLKEQLEEME